MKSILLTLTALLFVVPSMSMAAQKMEGRPVSGAVICDGKSSAANYVKALSDYELLRGMSNLMGDQRMASLRTAHDIQVWLNDQPDCASWTDGTYILEVKWLYVEAIARGLGPTLTKLAQGAVRWNTVTERFEERVNERWIAWTPYMK